MKKNSFSFLIIAFVFILSSPVSATANQTESVSLKWLDNSSPAEAIGISWGVPWPKGTTPKTQSFALKDSKNNSLLIQTWPLAYWPDGSLKWSGFATVAGPNTIAPLKLTPGGGINFENTLVIKVKQTDKAIEIDTGVLRCRIPTEGDYLIESMSIDGRQVAQKARLVCILQHGPDSEIETAPKEKFQSNIEKVSIEQQGPVRAVVHISGNHKSIKNQRTWLPFNVRLYFYAGLSSIRMVHTIIYDGDHEKDFIRGLGLTFEVPMREQIHNRHVRFSGPDSGLWAEPIQPLTGRQRLIFQGRNVYADQLLGKRVPDKEEFRPARRKLIDDWAIWSDFKLLQSNADGFTIQKRTNPKSCWLNAGAGKRASGLVFVGDVTGGLAVGLKDFWQSYPSALEIRNASTDTAELRLWLWPPDVPAMDMRHYDIKAHDLDSSYEDVQQGFSTPYGIARTSELMLYPIKNVPSKQTLLNQVYLATQPPLLVCTPEYLHSAGAFGVWSLPDRSTPGKRWLEDQLDAAVAQYQKEIDQRYWYGFWNYGDVMHAYDRYRHVWRYDIGGYAWDNTELMPDMWLWYSFLRSGRADIFRMAEAMTRHTGEVDVYHLGRFAGLGSRHNVRHWGCGAKEVRMSQAPLRRFYYYLTTDERTGDLMREVAANAEAALGRIDPMRLYVPPSRYPTHARIGPDWLALVGNWMTQWERTADPRWRQKIMVGVECFSEMPYGFFSAEQGVFGYDPNTSMIYSLGDDPIGVTHLSVLMGGPEVAFELFEFLDSPEFEKLWLQYCEIYGAPIEKVKEVFDKNIPLGDRGPHYARLPAYAAKIKNDPELARHAWDQFLRSGRWRRRNTSFFTPTTVNPPDVLSKIQEVPRISTNNTAQWCLNAIELLELVGDYIPENNPLWDKDNQSQPPQ